MEHNVILPAEWYPQSAVQLTWPHENTDWAPILDEVIPCFVAIAKEVIKREKLLIVCPDETAVREQLGEVDYDRVIFREMDTNDTWARDHGGISVFDEGTPMLYDFVFNGWGMKFAANHDNLITRNLCHMKTFSGEVVPANMQPFVLEGGSIESDGKGTLMTTVECLASVNRNEYLQQEELERYLKDVFGLDRILWITSGYLAGDDTDSHVDTLARFCSEDTIAYVRCEDEEDEHYEELKAMEEEIVSTLSIEQIDTSRDSVRKILSGYAPANESEKRIYAMKKGLEFIVDPAHQISDENLRELYEMTIGVLLPEEDRLLPGNLYRNGSVYVVGDKVEHTGLSWKKLPEYMGALIGFANMDGDMNDLLKAALLHFDLAYLHPYFDGNGRMARLLHLWYLVQRGYSSALFVPLSGFIERSRKGYYDAYTLIEQNARISGVLDVTPFLVYFIENVYHKLSNALPAASTTEHYQAALASGGVTEKEKDLWQFVLSAYGGGEFSTKQLERDFGSAAYATIRSFVLKFEGMGLLHRTKYGNRVKYSVK